MKCLVLLFVVLAPGLARAGTLTVKGSDTLVMLAQRWAEELGKRQTEVRVQVTGGGTGTGIAALINGTTDIATASRKMKSAEKQKLETKTKQPVVEIAVAKDGVAFYVHESNPVRALTMAELRDIYLGDLTNWKQVGGPDKKIVLYSRENSSGTYAFVKEHLLKDLDFAPEAQTLPGTAAVVNAVAQEPYGIGFGGGAYASGVKELKIRLGEQEIGPSLENVQSGAYPLSRDLFFYLAQAPKGDAAAYVDFALSKEGQNLASKMGYYPVK